MGINLADADKDEQMQELMTKKAVTAGYIQVEFMRKWEGDRECRKGIRVVEREDYKKGVCIRSENERE